MQATVSTDLTRKQALQKNIAKPETAALLQRFEPGGEVTLPDGVCGSSNVTISDIMQGPTPKAQDQARIRHLRGPGMA